MLANVGPLGRGGRPTRRGDDGRGAREGDAALARARSSADTDATVRSQAAWSLGAAGDPTDLARLQELARAADVDPATNATAAIGRIAGPRGRADLASTLCALAGDPRVFVRANAFAGLARSQTRCGDGSPERSALAGDPAEEARAAAVLAISVRPSADDARALERCARTDASSAIAASCRAAGRSPLAARTHAALVYVVPDGSDAPRPNASYALLFADGTLRAGTTDRRGAVFEPRAPEGDVTLRRPTP